MGLLLPRQKPILSRLNSYLCLSPFFLALRFSPQVAQRASSGSRPVLLSPKMILRMNKRTRMLPQPTRVLVRIAGISASGELAGCSVCCGILANCGFAENIPIVYWGVFNLGWRRVLGKSASSGRESQARTKINIPVTLLSGWRLFGLFLFF